MSDMNGVATMTMYDVLTLSEAAAFLKVSEAEVRAEAEAGRLIGRAVAGNWRFLREEVLKWVRTPPPGSLNGKQLSAIGSMADESADTPTIVTST